MAEQRRSYRRRDKTLAEEDLAWEQIRNKAKISLKEALREGKQPSHVGFQIDEIAEVFKMLLMSVCHKLFS